MNNSQILTKEAYVAFNYIHEEKQLHLKAGSSINAHNRMYNYLYSSFLNASNLIYARPFTNFCKKEQQIINTLRKFKDDFGKTLKKNFGIDIVLHHAPTEDMRSNPYPAERGIDQKIYNQILEKVKAEMISCLDEQIERMQLGESAVIKKTRSKLTKDTSDKSLSVVQQLNIIGKQFRQRKILEKI